ncbi:hypothetical protein M0R72_17810 [Candidatus Pacearchaeota archaeon]|jgi:hypothetical protein|nr:hypothetical protein [Candidatus Pacearchaeota archaeon]
MKAQTTLTTFSAPQTALPCPNRCQECINRCGPIQSIGGKLKVRCFCALKDVREGCPSFSDGTELKAMEQFKPPEGWQAKKWRGE